MSSQEISDLLSANQGKDRYNAPDFYAIDDLLTDEQKYNIIPCICKYINSLIGS